jgi:hypothetical protein
MRATSDEGPVQLASKLPTDAPLLRRVIPKEVRQNPTAHKPW